MRGYWGRRAEDTAAFLHLDGDRWYDTGDLGASNEEGEIVFHGRRDRMVKRRGYRIELGEIEAGLDHADFLSESAVVCVDERGSIGIHAIVAPVAPVAGEKASVIRLRTHCASALPACMAPDRFHVVDSLPRTRTGKVNLERLRSEVVDQKEARG